MHAVIYNVVTMDQYQNIHMECVHITIVLKLLAASDV